MLLTGLCFAVTMSGGARLPDRSEFALLNGSGVDFPAPLLFEAEHGPEPIVPADLVNAIGAAGSADGLGARTARPHVGGATQLTRAPAPLKRGPVDRYLENAEVNDGVQRLLSAIREKLAGYPTVLEVVKDPDDSADSAFVMVSVCMREDDQVAWDLVEHIIDEHWLALSPHVRGALGVGRELVSVG